MGTSRIQAVMAAKFREFLDLMPRDTPKGKKTRGEKTVAPIKIRISGRKKRKGKGDPDVESSEDEGVRSRGL